MTKYKYPFKLTLKHRIQIIDIKILVCILNFKKKIRKLQKKRGRLQWKELLN